MKWTPIRKLRACPRLVHGIDAVASLALAVAFVASAVPHLGNPYYFLSSVYRYGLVGPQVGQAAAMILPMLGLAVAACLVTGFWRDAAHVVSGAMVLTFAAVQTFAWVNEMAIPCGCFGPTHDQTIGATSLTIAGALVVLSLIRNVLCLGAPTRQTPEPVSPETEGVLQATVL